MIVLIVSTLATWAMVGLIWMVQVVHYPMLAGYCELVPQRAAQEHQGRISFVVGPLMAAEGVTALILLVERPAPMTALTAWLAAALLGVALASTVFVQVPLHSRLAAGPDRDATERLIATNWVRTAAWTARGLVLAWALAAL